MNRQRLARRKRHGFLAGVLPEGFAGTAGECGRCGYSAERYVVHPDGTLETPVSGFRKNKNDLAIGDGFISSVEKVQGDILEPVVACLDRRDGLDFARADDQPTLHF